MVASSRDAAMMARAIVLAERGRGVTSPNPVVGAVVTASDGPIVGQGAHLALGAAHAEVAALDAAGDRARGGTLYCTLEPCVHTGRTGPCVERIVRAGISRVVTAIEDPNPVVNGRGHRYLRDRGIEVTEGVGAEGARRQNGPFLTWLHARRPFVTLKCAVSADGFVGRAGEGRLRLTGPVADRFFQRQRAGIDAIAVGSGTVLADNPRLTARGAFRARPLTRVLFDWRGRIPATAAVFSTLDAGPVIMFTTEAAADQHADTGRALAALGVRTEVLSVPDVVESLTRLAARDLQWLLVEGGPALQSAFIEAGVVDHAQWVFTPVRLGHGVRSVSGFGRAVAWREPPRARRLGDDVLIEGDVYRIDRDDGTD